MKFGRNMIKMAVGLSIGMNPGSLFNIYSKRCTKERDIKKTDF
jgi:hypothetical protein